MAAPILFLDFDGVLNRSGTETRFTFPDGATFTGLDPENVERLNWICERVPEALIVVSSTWRTVLDVPGLRSALAKFGFRFPERVIDRTPRLRRFRGLEVQAWLDAQPEAPRSIAILDDAEDMVHLDARLVRTDWDAGLTETDARVVAEMLSQGAASEAA